MKAVRTLDLADSGFGEPAVAVRVERERAQVLEAVCAEMGKLAGRNGYVTVTYHLIGRFYKQIAKEMGTASQKVRNQPARGMESVRKMVIESPISG